MDIILYNILVGFCSLLLGYLFGSIPTGVIFGKVFFHSDVRDFGSKNSGGTNVARVYGKWYGITVILLDMLKVAIPLFIVWAVFKFSSLQSWFAEGLGQPMWNPTFYIYLAPLGAALGHCWPLYAGFRGGKTVSVFCGFAIYTNWFITILGALTFFGTLKKTKYVSLSSMLTAAVGTLLSWTLFILKITALKDQPIWLQNITMWGAGEFVVCGWEHAMVVTVIAALLVIRHKANIKRLIAGTENKVGSKKKEAQEQPQNSN